MYKYFFYEQQSLPLPAVYPIIFLFFSFSQLLSVIHSFKYSSSCSFCIDTTDSLLHFSVSSCFSNISKTKREQEKLVWSQSLCGSNSRWPVEENWEMQQHPQSKMEATSHCVSQSLTVITTPIWHLITFMIQCSNSTHLTYFLMVCMHANSFE